MVFKKILFILILPFFLYAQWTDPRPKSIQLWHLNTSFFDSLGNVVRDSVAALSADSTTIANVSGTFKQVVFADTAALTATTGLEAGGRFIIKQLSSGNVEGGGVFVKIPKGYVATPDNVVAFTNADGDTLIREELLSSGIVNVRWAGAKGDNSTNDSLAIAKAILSAKVNRGGIVVFPEGIYKYTGTIDISSPNSGQQERSFVIAGEGIGKTRLLPTTDTDALKTNVDYGKYSYNVVVKDMSIIGPLTAATSTAKGVDFAYTLLGVVERCQIENFKYGIYTNWCNSPVFRNNRIRNNWAGVYGDSTANEYVLENNYITDSDSMGWYHGTGINPVWRGGAMGGNPIHLYQAGSTSITIHDGNWESYTWNAIYSGSNATVSIFGLSITGGISGRTFRLGSSTYHYAYDVVISNLTTQAEGPVYMASATSRFINYTRRQIRAYRGHNGVNADYFNTTPYWSRADNAGTPTADSTNEGKIDHYKPRNISGLTDRLVWYQDMGPTYGYYENELSMGTDWRGNKSDVVGTQPSRIERLAFTVIEKDTITLAGDSTVVFFEADTNGVGSYYIVGGWVDRTSGTAADHLGGAWIEPQNYSTSTGKIRVLVWHPNATSGSINIKVMAIAIYQRDDYGE